MLFEALAVVSLIGLSWSGFRHLIAWAIGWKTLAKHYRADRRIGSQTLGYCQIELWRTNEATSMTPASKSRGRDFGLRFTVFNDGLQIAYMGLQAIGLSPLLIPWDELTVSGKRGRYEYDGGVTLTFAKEPSVQMTVNGNVADTLMKLGAPWRLTEDGDLERSESRSAAAR